MTPNNLVHENERLDELHRNGYYIIQDPARFCFGMDAVLLSGFARARRGERVLDLGTGTGIIPILMEAKTEAKILPRWRFRKRARIWREEAYYIITWKKRSGL